MCDFSGIFAKIGRKSQENPEKSHIWAYILAKTHKIEKSLLQKLDITSGKVYTKNQVFWTIRPISFRFSPENRFSKKIRAKLRFLPKICHFYQKFKKILEYDRN